MEINPGAPSNVTVDDRARRNQEVPETSAVPIFALFYGPPSSLPLIRRVVTVVIRERRERKVELQGWHESEP